MKLGKFNGRTVLITKTENDYQKVIDVFDNNIKTIKESKSYLVNRDDVEEMSNDELQNMILSLSGLSINTETKSTKNISSSKNTIVKRKFVKTISDNIREPLIKFLYSTGNIAAICKYCNITESDFNHYGMKFNLTRIADYEFRPYTSNEDKAIKLMRQHNISSKVMSEMLNRTYNAIQFRIHSNNW